MSMTVEQAKQAPPARITMTQSNQIYEQSTAQIRAFMANGKQRTWVPRMDKPTRERLRRIGFRVAHNGSEFNRCFGICVQWGSYAAYRVSEKLSTLNADE